MGENFFWITNYTVYVKFRLGDLRIMTTFSRKIIEKLKKKLKFRDSFDKTGSWQFVIWSCLKSETTTLLKWCLLSSTISWKKIFFRLGPSEKDKPYCRPRSLWTGRTKNKLLQILPAYWADNFKNLGFWSKILSWIFPNTPLPPRSLKNKPTTSILSEEQKKQYFSKTF